jgi:hypothetical protein
MSTVIDNRPPYIKQSLDILSEISNNPKYSDIKDKLVEVSKNIEKSHDILWHSLLDSSEVECKIEALAVKMCVPAEFIAGDSYYVPMAIEVIDYMELKWNTRNSS